VKAKAHGLHSGNKEFGLKIVDLNVNIDIGEVLKEYKDFMKEQSNLYKKLEKELLTRWIEEKGELL